MTRADRLAAALRRIADINLGPDRASGEYRCTEAAAIAEEALAGPADDWLPVTEEQRDGNVYLLCRGDPSLSVFAGYWDDRAGGWYSVAGAYAMIPEPAYMPVPKSRDL